MQVELALHRPVVRTYALRSASLERAYRALERRGWWGRYQPRERMTYARNERGRVEALLVTAKPVITLPAWSNEAKAPSADRRAWKRMLAALERHERQHHRFFVQAAKEWKCKLEARRDLSEAVANREWDALNRRATRLQRGYDRRTAHGRAEGVALARR